MYKRLLLSINVLGASIVSAQAPAPSKLSVHWAELTAAEFRDAITRAQGTCLLPFGIMEKHGPHLPLGNDLLNVRYVAINAAQQEYAVVFPEYYFGQIAEATHQPGTVAYSRRLQLDLLQETTNEMARNGCKKIIIANGHGGNNSLLPYFAQTQLATPHDYVVYVLDFPSGGPDEPKHKTNPATDMHAGESETSLSLIARPDLVHLDRAAQESGADQARQQLPEGVYQVAEKVGTGVKRPRFWGPATNTEAAIVVLRANVEVAASGAVDPKGFFSNLLDVSPVARRV